MQNFIKTLYAYRLSFETSVGAVLYYVGPNGIRYLLLKYPHGHWDFVKGHVERGETEKQTLVREAEEEVSIPEDQLVVRDGFRERVGFSYRAKGTEYDKRVKNGNGIFVVKKVFYYIARSKQTSVALSHEHIGHEWLPYETALERITFENSKNILRKANALIKVE